MTAQQVSSQLAALERHLHEDEESSNESRSEGNSSPQLHLQEDNLQLSASSEIGSWVCSTPVQTTTVHGDDQEGGSSSSHKRTKVRRHRITMTLTTQHRNPSSESTRKNSWPKKRNGKGNNNNNYSNTEGGSHNPLSDSRSTTVVEDESGSVSSGSSMDSTKNLERWAHRIREEIRHSEMVELAMEAERAAAAGKERFAGHASTFGVADEDDDETNNNSNNNNNNHNKTKVKKPLRMRRNRTYSEGFVSNIPRPVLRRRKIRVLALRNIEEVVPSMSQLHRHITTHLHHRGVDTDKLRSQEENVADMSTLSEGSLGASPKPTRSFLHNLKSWVSSVGSDAEEEKQKSEELLVDDEIREGAPSDDDDDDDDTSMHEFEVGDRLAQHGVDLLAKWKPSPVRIPPGLVLPDNTHEWNAVQWISTPIKKAEGCKTDAGTIGTTPTASSSDMAIDSKLDCADGSAPLNHSITPIALFEGNGGGEPSSEEAATPLSEVVFDAPCTPIEASRPQQSSIDLDMPCLFLTPVRLRGIRDRKRGGGLSMSMSHLSWTNSVDSGVRSAGSSRGGSYVTRSDTLGEAFVDNESTQLKAADSDSCLYMPVNTSGRAGRPLKPRSRSRSVGDMLTGSNSDDKLEYSPPDSRDLYSRSMDMQPISPPEISKLGDSVETDIQFSLSSESMGPPWTPTQSSDGRSMLDPANVTISKAELQIPDLRDSRSNALVPFSRKDNAESTHEDTLSSRPDKAESTHEGELSSRPDSAESTHEDALSERPDNAESTHEGTLSSRPDNAESTHEDALSERPDNAESTHEDTLCSRPDKAESTHEGTLSSTPDSAESTHEGTPSSTPDNAESTHEDALSSTPDNAESTHEGKLSSTPDSAESTHKDTLSERPHDAESTHEDALFSAPDSAGSTREDTLSERAHGAENSREDTLFSAPDSAGSTREDAVTERQHDAESTHEGTHEDTLSERPLDSASMHEEALSLAPHNSGDSEIPFDEASSIRDRLLSAARDQSEKQLKNEGETKAGEPSGEAGRKRPGHHVEHSFVMDESFVERLERKLENASVDTPSVQNCECMGLSSCASFESEASQKRRASNSGSQLLKRVTSCPSLADALGSQTPTTGRTGGNGLMGVLSRISPTNSRKSGRAPFATEKDNHKFLSNYFYCNTPSRHEHSDLNKDFCVGCDVTTCDGLEGVFFNQSTLFRRIHKPRRHSFNIDSSVSVGRSPGTWFEAATEKFDTALERLVGGERLSSRWEKRLQAPSLHLRTPRTTKRTPTRLNQVKVPELVGGPRPRLHRDLSLGSVDSFRSADTHLTDVQFEFLYGVSRAEERLLPERDRIKLRQETQERRGHWMTHGGLHLFDVKNPSPRSKLQKPRHRSMWSSSDILLVNRPVSHEWEGSAKPDLFG